MRTLGTKDERRRAQPARRATCTNQEPDYRIGSNLPKYSVSWPLISTLCLSSSAKLSTSQFNAPKAAAFRRGQAAARARFRVFHCIRLDVPSRERDLGRQVDLGSGLLAARCTSVPERRDRGRAAGGRWGLKRGRRRALARCHRGRADAVLRWLDRENRLVAELMTLHGVDAFVQVVRQRIETEGLRPFSMRTGIPLGQLRSVVQARAARYTTLQSIASVMGMRLFIAPAEPSGMEAPPLPAELTRALDLPSDASVVDAVDAIDQDAVASKLRKGMRLVQEMTELATAAAELLPQVAGGSKTRMIPFAEHVRFEADTGEVAFEESSDLSIAVAERVLPSWRERLA